MSIQLTAEHRTKPHYSVCGIYLEKGSFVYEGKKYFSRWKTNDLIFLSAKELNLFLKDRFNVTVDCRKSMNIVDTVFENNKIQIIVLRLED